MRWLALAAVIANAVIICTGEAVRLSSSGLGCPDWPQCTQTSVVAAHSSGQTSLNTAIEFSNRLLNFPLVAIAALAFIACWQYRPGGQRRRDLVWLSAALPLGVVAQAVVGGIVVLTKLNPAMVAVHFLLSSVIPYWLEFEALRRVPPRVFGVWMSLQPAVAALIGLAML
ncbi:MAG TPA: COX15/CtaA family protein, partial [Trebonia sp.]|nr:COX15/CtaA family protein [Trebonia sp.]